MWRLSTLLLYLSIDVVISTVDYLQHPVKSCHIGDVVENECNKCSCTSKTVFECTPLDCNRNKNHKEYEATRQLCYPSQLYVQNLITCICTKDGKWPHKSCYDTFQSLPPSKVVKHKCIPDTYVPIDCNICRCGADGEINTDRCTRNACEDEIKRRVNSEHNSLYSKCEVQNWYSLAPCQFCYCVNKNKLVCNTGNNYAKNFELGSYNLKVCGKELIREAIELIPDKQNVLRYSLLNNASKTTMGRGETTTASTTQIFTSHEVLIDDFELNRENNGEKATLDQTKPVQKNYLSSNKEYYSDQEEEPQNQQIQQKPQKLLRATTVRTVQKRTTKPQEPQASSTLFPFEEGDEMLGELDMKTEEDSDKESNEIELELKQDPVDPSDKTKTDLYGSPDKKNKLSQTKKSAESYQYVGNTLKINIPKVLNNVFRTALRKSMVSLTSETKCVKGTTSLSDCNMCFCLKNGKLLCTNNKCTDVKKSK